MMSFHSITRHDTDGNALAREGSEGRSVHRVNAGDLSGSLFTWRRPYVMAARVGLNMLYRAWRCDERANEAVFISRQNDDPRYDFAMIAREFHMRGWKTTMHMKKVTARDPVGYLKHVLAEVRLLGRCKVAILDRYDPVVSLIDFECDGEGCHDATSALVERVDQSGCANVAFPRKPVILQLWHAFGSFKRFGFQTVDTLEGHPSDFIRDWRIHHNYSWVVCSGENARTAFAEAFSCPIERVVPLNRPEYDKLMAKAHMHDTPINVKEATANNQAHAERPSCASDAQLSLNGALINEGHRESRMRVLMAPTLRKSSKVSHPMRDLYAMREAFESFVDADIVWAFHPLEEGLPAPGDVSGELLECDIVVTDYSSLVYEAYLLGKQVLFYVPDIDSYRVTPGLNRDPLDLAPGLCARDEGEIIVLLQILLEDPRAYPLDQLQRFIGDAFDAPANSSVASRIVDFLIEHASAC